MAETAKIPKSAVLYIHLQGTNYKCKDCLFAKRNATQCGLYGAMESIKPYGGCGEFIFTKSHPTIPWIGGYTKENTGYVENQPGFTCGRCDEFLPDKEDCKKVDKDSPGDDPGKIVSRGCCNRWELKHEHAE